MKTMRLILAAVLLLAGMVPAGAQTKINGSRVLEGTLNYCESAAGNDTYACSLSPAIVGYVTGGIYHFKADVANTGAATLNLNGLGAKTIKKVAGGVTTDLADNDIRAGQLVAVIYDGTNLQMLSQLGNAGGGAINTHRVRATKDATQSVNDATTTAITWNTEVYDDGGLHDTVTNNTRLTAVTAGVYVIACTIEWPGINAHIATSIRLNGTTMLQRASMVGNTSTANYGHVSGTYKLAQNDYVECMGRQNQGGAQNVAVAESNFNMARVQD